MKTFESFYPKFYWNQFAQQDITDLFIEDIALALATWSNRFFYILGDPGTGKSLLEISLGQLISAMTGGKFSVKANMTSDLDGFRRLLSEAKDFGVVTLDETLDYHGRGSLITFDAVKNLMKAAARFKQINAVMVGNEFVPLRLFHYVLLTRERYVNDDDWRKTDTVTAEVWCLPVGTRIASNPKQIAIENIRPGDSVLAHDGHYSMVEATAVKSYDGPMVELYTFGRALRATPNHVIPYIPSPRRYPQYRNARANGAVKHADVVWGPIGNVKQGDFVFLPRVRKVVDREFVELIERQRNGGTKKKTVFLTDKFLKLCGLFVAEGSLTKNGVILSLGPHEGWMADLAVDWFAELGVRATWRKRRHRSSLGEGEFIQVNACSAPLARFLDAAFYSRQRSGRRSAKEKAIPTWMLYLPMAKLKPLLSGMWMGDGTIVKGSGKGYQQYRLTYTTSSPVLKQQVEAILMRLGFLPHLAEVLNTATFKNASPSYTVNVTGKQLGRLGKILGGRFMEAKGRGQQFFKTRAAFLAPVSTVSTSLYSGPVYDLQVSTKERLGRCGRPRLKERMGTPSYVAEGISVHNSKVWEDLTGNFFPIGRATLPAPDDATIAEYGRAQKVKKVADVQAEGGIVERGSLEANFLRLNGRALATHFTEECPTCGKKTLKGYTDGKVVHWVCWKKTCRDKTLPDTPVPGVK